MAAFGLGSCGGDSAPTPPTSASAAPATLRGLPLVPSQIGEARLWQIEQGTLVAQNGDRLRQVYYSEPFVSAAGPDGVFFTADDAIATYTEYRRDPQTKVTMWGSFSGPGSDGAWFSADDQFAPGTYFSKRLNARGEIEEECSFQTSEQDVTAARGPDETWFTFDDIPYQCSRLVTPLRYIQFTSSGIDATWKTDDDVANYYLKFERDAQGRVTSRAGFYVGDDGKLDTTDDFAEGPATRYIFDDSGEWIVDVLAPPQGEDEFRQNSVAKALIIPVGYRERVRYDTTTRPLFRIVFSSPGSDAIWDNADDIMAAATQWQYIADAASGAYLQLPQSLTQATDFFHNAEIAKEKNIGLVSRIAFYSLDLPFSGDTFADDRLVGYEQFMYTDGSTIERLSFGVGADGTASTDDDPINGRTVARKGIIEPDDIVVISYKSAGADRVWRTEDDEVDRYTLWRQISLLEGVTATEQYAVSGAGADRLWFTSDDVATLSVALEKVATQ